MNKSTLLFSGLLFAGLLTFFLIMKALGLYTNVNLRVLNVLIHGAVVYFAMRTFRNSQEGKFSYLQVFAEGFKTSILPVLAFAVFQFAYLQYLNPDFFMYVKENAIMGSMLTPFLASLFLVFEGLAVAIFTAYIGMRILTVKENVPSVSGYRNS